MPCASSATIQAKVEAKDAGNGTHTFGVVVDGTPQTCTVAFNGDNRPVEAKCDGRNMRLVFGPKMEQVEVTLPVPNGKPLKAHTEKAVPGQFGWNLELYGQPNEVRVTHGFAGKTVADRSAKFAYTEPHPNGPGCDPGCRKAVESWN